MEQFARQHAAAVVDRCASGCRAVRFESRLPLVGELLPRSCFPMPPRGTVLTKLRFHPVDLLLLSVIATRECRAKTGRRGNAALNVATS